MAPATATAEGFAARDVARDHQPKKTGGARSKRLLRLKPPLVAVGAGREARGERSAASVVLKAGLVRIAGGGVRSCGCAFSGRVRGSVGGYAHSGTVRCGPRCCCSPSWPWPTQGAARSRAAASKAISLGRRRELSTVHRTISAARLEACGERREQALATQPRSDEFPDGGSQTPPVESTSCSGHRGGAQSSFGRDHDALREQGARRGRNARQRCARGKLHVTLDDGVVFSGPIALWLRMSARCTTRGRAGASRGRHRYRALRTRGARVPHLAELALFVVHSREQIGRRARDHQDNSDMGKDFPSDQDGQYDLRVRLRARVEK